MSAYTEHDAYEEVQHWMDLFEGWASTALKGRGDDAVNSAGEALQESITDIRAELLRKDPRLYVVLAHFGNATWMLMVLARAFKAPKLDEWVKLYGPSRPGRRANSDFAERVQATMASASCGPAKAAEVVAAEIEKEWAAEDNARKVPTPDAIRRAYYRKYAKNG